MSVQHTPGPWIADTETFTVHSKQRSFVTGGYRVELNMVNGSHADLQIAAASPRLLAACQTALVVLEAWITDDADLGFEPEPDVLEAVQELRTAIAEARA